MRHQWRNSDFNLSPRDISLLIEAAETRRDKLLLSLLAYTGIRRAELGGLEVDDIDPTRRQLIIRRGKGGKQRIVFYPSDLDVLLEEQRASSGQGPLFPGRFGQALSLRAINKIVARVGHAATVDNPNPRYENITPHLLRHSLARNWKNAGASLESLQKLLGHSSFSTTMDLYGTEGLQQTRMNYAAVAQQLVSASHSADKARPPLDEEEGLCKQCAVTVPLRT